MRRFDGLLLAGVSVLVVLLAAACGTRYAASSYPLTGPSPITGRSPKVSEEGYCPQVPGVVAASPCVSLGVQQNQRDNQMFNSRVPLPGPVAARAAPLTRRIRESVQGLTPAQRLRVSAVRSALLAGGMLSTDLVVSGGSPYDSVTFGGYELLNTRPAVCAWGTVTAKAVEVNSGGITREGACLPSAGGH